MAYPAINTAITYQRPQAIKKVFIKTGSEKWQTLGQIRNGELKVTPYSTKNTYQQNLHIGSFTFEAKFEMLQTATAEVELIDSIIDGSNSFLFQLTDAGAITTGATEGWVTVSNTQIGVKARLVSDGTPDTNQFIEVMIKGSLKNSEIDAALKAAVATADFHISTTASGTYSNNAGSAGGTIFGYYIDTTANNNTGVMANIKPNGFSSVVLDDALSAGTVTLGRTGKSKLIFDWVAEEDSLGRHNVYGIDVELEYEYLVTDAATLLLLAEMNLVNTNAVVTLLDGKAFTLNSKLGVEIGFEDIGDFSGHRKLRFIHKGRILKSDFDGVVA